MFRNALFDSFLLSITGFSNAQASQFLKHLQTIGNSLAVITSLKRTPKSTF